MTKTFANPQLTKNGELKHLLSIEGLSRDILTDVLDTAQQFVSVSDSDREVKKVPLLRGKSVFNLFFENSTRTRTTFEIAAKRLSADVINLNINASSTSKGESLLDTINNLSAMQADMFVVRHASSGAPYLIAEHVAPHVHVINAGDGRHAHPTQGLLDMYTIKDELGRIDGVRVAMVGDLANGRTVRSLAYLLSKYKDVEVVFVAPPQVAMRQDIKDHLDEHGVRWSEEADLERVLSEADVVYQTRIQKERFTDEADYRAVKGVYRIDPAAMARFNPKGILMHPLPRVDEIDPAVDSDPRSAYFRQARNGVPIRMAVLDMVLS